MKITSEMFFGVIFLCVFWIFTWPGNVLDKARGTNASNSLFISNKIATAGKCVFMQTDGTMLQEYLNIGFSVDCLAEMLQEILYMYIKAPLLWGLL